jgi:hypothetical protein
LKSRTNIGARKKIVKAFNKLGNYKAVEKHFNGVYSYYQIWNAVNGRTKKNYSGRSDKGKMRTTKDKVQEQEQVQEQDVLGPEDFDSAIGFMKHQVLVSLRDLSKRSYSADQRIKMLKDISALQKNIEAMELESHLANPEAKLILNVMRALAPKKSDAELLKVYAEQREILKRNLQNS